MHSFNLLVLGTGIVNAGTIKPREPTFTIDWCRFSIFKPSYCYTSPSPAPKPPKSTTTTQWTTTTAPYYAPPTTTTTKTSTTTTTSNIKSTIIVPTYDPLSTTKTTTSSSPDTYPTLPANICGVAGYDRQSPAAFRANNAYDASFTTCRDFCVAYDSQSFAVGPSLCLCYNAPLTNNLNPVADSPNVFYDAGCQPNAGTSTMKSTTTEIVTSTNASTTTTPGNCFCPSPVTVTVTATAGVYAL